jgi:hypothetical protein
MKPLRLTFLAVAPVFAQNDNVGWDPVTHCYEYDDWVLGCLIALTVIAVGFLISRLLR